MHRFLIPLLCVAVLSLAAGPVKAPSKPVTPSDGLAEEKTTLNAKDLSRAKEHSLKYLKPPIIDTAPKDLKDGIAVGTLAKADCDQAMILKLTDRIAKGTYGNIDSLLIYHKGKLVLESYYRRGRVWMPHFQMSITKSITALAIGRAMQLGYIKDLNTPVVDYLKTLDRSKLAPGACKITIAECLNMGSGIRISAEKANAARRNRKAMQGQGQAQAILSLTAPVTKESKAYKYQSTDPSLVMQVVEAVVPGTAKEFIKKEILTPMGITQYFWQPDISGLPKSAAGSSFRSRDMLKFGLLVANEGQWGGKQLWSKAFLSKAVSGIYTNAIKHTYGYFWWGNTMTVNGKGYRCVSGRGAGGQFIFVLPKLEMVVVVTSHNKAKAMRYPFDFLGDSILPAFVK